MKIGTFKGKCIEAALCSSKGGNGTEYIGVMMQVTSDDCKGEEIGGRLFWTEKTQDATKKALAHLGWKGEVDQEGGLVGLPNIVDFAVAEEEYQGKKSLKVDWVGEPRMSGINAADRLTQRSASDMLRGMRAGLPGAPSGNGQKRKAAPPPQDEPPMGREMGDDTPDY